MAELDDSRAFGAGLNPSQLPLVDNGAQVRAAANALQARMADVLRVAESVRSQWQALGASYRAPEAAQLVAAMSPPVERADQLLADHATAHTALMTYAMRLEELATRRTALVGTLLTLKSDWQAFDAQKAKVYADVSYSSDMDSGSWETGTDPEAMNALDSAAQGLEARDSAAAKAMAQFCADVAAADNECGNAISGIFGGPQYSRAGETDVTDPHVSGATVETYEAALGAGQSPWGDPQSWSDGSSLTPTRRFAEQFGGAFAGLDFQLRALVGQRGDGARSAVWSSMRQQFTDFVNLAAAPGGTVDAGELEASQQRFMQMVKGSVAWDQWGHDSAGASANLAFNGALVLVGRGFGKGVGSFGPKALSDINAGLARMGRSARLSSFELYRPGPRVALAGGGGAGAGQSWAVGSSLAAGARRLEKLTGTMLNKAHAKKGGRQVLGMATQLKARSHRCRVPMGSASGSTRTKE